MVDMIRVRVRVRFRFRVRLISSIRTGFELWLIGLGI